MDIQEILVGLQFRINSLQEARKVLSACEHEAVVSDYESRIDELESVYQWIKENS